jgi:hypothetical protein
MHYLQFVVRAVTTVCWWESVRTTNRQTVNRLWKETGYSVSLCVETRRIIHVTRITLNYRYSLQRYAIRSFGQLGSTIISCYTAAQTSLLLTKFMLVQPQVMEVEFHRFINITAWCVKMTPDLVAVQFKTRKDLDCSKIWIVGSNPARSIDVYPRLSVLCCRV